MKSHLLAVYTHDDVGWEKYIYNFITPRPTGKRNCFFFFADVQVLQPEP